MKNLDDLIKERNFATSNAQRQSIKYKLTVAEKYLEVLREGSFVPEPTTLTGFLCVLKEAVEGYRY